MGQAGKTQESELDVYWLAAARRGLAVSAASLLPAWRIQAERMCRQHNFPICWPVSNGQRCPRDWPPALPVEVDTTL